MKTPFDVSYTQKVDVKNCQYVGVHLPPHAARQLTLLSLISKVPKSYYLRRALMPLFQKNTSESLLLILSTRAYQFWMEHCEAWMSDGNKKRNEQLLSDYIKSVETVLKKRGMNDEDTNIISQELRRKIVL